MTAIPFPDEYVAAQLVTRLASGLNWQVDKAFVELGLHINSQDQIVSSNPDLDVATNPIFVAINNYREGLKELTHRLGEITGLDRDILALQGTIEDLELDIAGKDITIQSQLDDMELMTLYIIDVEDGVAELSAQIVALTEVPSYVLPVGGWENYVVPEP